jgi:predicted nucleotidyltransferase component of viral defense system
VIPAAPDANQLADWCRETAATERVQPWTVEKDFFLTRLIWALAQFHGENLLLKGGTCLSKVDLGYHRMSEDMDLTIPGEPTRYQSTNSSLVNRVARSIQDLEPEVGVKLLNFDGERSERGAHAIWEVAYPSGILPSDAALITVEVSIQPPSMPTRRAALRQLLPGNLAHGYSDAFCWALDFAEVRAEKVRAGYTRERPEIRDYYDLGLLAKGEVDMQSAKFRELIDRKLAEVGARPLADQPASFGLTGRRRRIVDGDHAVLESLLRIGDGRFDLQHVLDHYDRIWAKSPPVLQ